MQHTNISTDDSSSEDIEFHFETDHHAITVRKKKRPQEVVGDLGGRLRRLRKERGITQEELAEAAGVAQSEISVYERGLRVPMWPVVRRLEEALGHPPVQLTDQAVLERERLQESLRTFLASPTADIMEVTPEEAEALGSYAWLGVDRAPTNESWAYYLKAWRVSEAVSRAEPAVAIVPTEEVPE